MRVIALVSLVGLPALSVAHTQRGGGSGQRQGETATHNKTANVATRKTLLSARQRAGS